VKIIAVINTKRKKFKLFRNYATESMEINSCRKKQSPRVCHKKLNGVCLLVGWLVSAIGSREKERRLKVTGRLKVWIMTKWSHPFIRYYKFNKQLSKIKMITA